jgi:DNA-binding MarR family transcriptional regulator
VFARGLFRSCRETFAFSQACGTKLINNYAMSSETGRHAAISDEALERHRQNNVRRLLVVATRTLNRHITSELQRRGYENTRPGHSALLANLDFGGNTVTEIAEHAQISKQAMARLAVELEDMGLITREPSASDGRALILRFTRPGKALVRASVAIVDEFERDLARKVGARSLAALKRGLSEIAEVL